MVRLADPKVDRGLGDRLGRLKAHIDRLVLRYVVRRAVLFGWYIEGCSELRFRGQEGALISDCTFTKGDPDSLVADRVVLWADHKGRRSRSLP